PPDTEHSRTNRSSLERYAFFLAFRQSNVQDAFAHLRQADIADRDLSSLLKELSGSATTLEELQRSLSQEDQSLLFSIYSADEYVPLLESIDVAKEWAMVQKKLQVASVTRQAAQIEHEIKMLDAKQNLTSAEEQHKNELLAQLVALKRQTPA
ncbi:hypothetical protein KC686_03575, partial [Candidatus Woesebacteria bacterium]|nr:hypothetical protein [Candidatus Woesebacteria bacterium]